MALNDSHVGDPREYLQMGSHKYRTKPLRVMKTFTVELTLSIDAMNEDSAENKLDAFLSALDLKKNEKVSLVDCSELSDGESAPSKSAGKAKAAEEDDMDWDDFDDEDIDWDDDEDEVPVNKKPKKLPKKKQVEETEDEDEDDSESDDEDDLDDLLNDLNAEEKDSPEAVVADDDDDDDEEDIDWDDDDENWDDWE